MKMYNLADWLSLDEHRSIAEEILGKKHRVGFTPNTPQRAALQRIVKAIDSGHFRHPKKGEWYISGSIPEAYRAPNDLPSKYKIAQLVYLEPVTETRVRFIGPFNFDRTS